MICKYCKRIFSPSHHSEKYCSENCRRVAKNEMHKKGRETKELTNDYTEFLTENIFLCVKEPYHLTTVGFDLVSPVGFKAYINHFKRKKWIDILQSLDLFEDLYQYIVKEYSFFVDKNGKQNLHLFCKEHRYITYTLLQSIGLNKIMQSAGIRKKRYSDEELFENFIQVKNIVGRLPLYQEFEKLSDISLVTYLDRFGIKGYYEILKMYFSDEEIKQYELTRSHHKIMNGRATGKLSRVHFDKDYELEFHRVVNFCFTEYGEFPSRRIFNMLSKIDESSYRATYSLSWNKVCEKYGYKINNSFKSEKMVLKLIKSVTGCNYISQKTFDWLKNDKGYSLFCDGFFEDLGLVVEFDGVQHRKPIEAFGGLEGYKNRKRNDEIKNIKIPKNGLKLLRIDSRDKWFEREYIKSRLETLNINILTK